ncbi:MAG: hypothetical protein ACRCZF_22035 [Gemmataceae bacterium]
MDLSPKWQLLEQCPLVEEAEWRMHVAAFVQAFIIPAKRGRWAELLLNRPRRINEYSHKMHSDLDRRVCRRLADNEWPMRLRGTGAFYGFSDEPRLVPAGQVLVAAGGGDAMYSLIAGELALYFFHEGECWLCGG